MTIRALALDADGTLWNTRAAMVAAAQAAARTLWLHASPEQCAAFGERFRADPSGAFRRFVQGELSFAQMRATRIDEAAASLGLPPGGHRVAAFEAAYAPVFDETLTAYVDAVGLLRWATEAGLHVRVLTNSAQAYTEAKAVATGLAELHGRICSRECVGVGKPKPEPFWHLCERLGVPPGEVVYVGDEWACDAMGATGAGLEAAWLVRDEEDPAGEVQASGERRAAAQAHGIPIIGSLTEVPALLADLGAGEGAG
ncbi:MAG: HAD family hydrolase [Tetrasphaera sp.]|nr:HAD family hydrolase [Tetrasphaera sp.]